MEYTSSQQQIFNNLALDKNALLEHIASDDYRHNVKLRESLNNAILDYQKQLDFLENPRTDSSNWFSWVSNSFSSFIKFISKFFGG